MGIQSNDPKTAEIPALVSAAAARTTLRRFATGRNAIAIAVIAGAAARSADELTCCAT